MVMLYIWIELPKKYRNTKFNGKDLTCAKAIAHACFCRKTKFKRLVLEVCEKKKRIVKNRVFFFLYRCALCRFLQKANPLPSATLFSTNSAVCMRLAECRNIYFCAYSSDRCWVFFFFELFFWEKDGKQRYVNHVSKHEFVDCA